MASVPIPYDVLRLIWWALLGILLIGFAVLDGYDLGTAMLLPFVGRSDAERRQVRETVEPNWEGHQVWFILGGGASFAAWPLLYAASFSGFYLAMFLVLLALIIRPVGFNFRDKLPGQPLARVLGLEAGGRRVCPVAGVRHRLRQSAARRAVRASMARCGSAIPAASSACSTRSAWPPASSARRCWRCMAAAWLALKADGPVALRAGRAARIFALIAAMVFALAGWWIGNRAIDGRCLLAGADARRPGPSNPLAKSVTRAAGAWIANYRAHPALDAAPAIRRPPRRCWSRWSGAAERASVAGLRWLERQPSVASAIVATAGIALFPFSAAVLDPSRDRA